MTDLFEWLDLQPAILAWCLLVTLLAGYVRGYSGFGFSALMVAGLSVMMAPAQIVPTILMLEVLASIHMLPRVWKHVDWSLLSRLLLGALCGLPFGLYLLAHLPDHMMRLVLYAVLLLLCLLLMVGYHFPAADRNGPRLLAGWFSGLANGAAALGGLPIVVFLTAAGMAAITMRASLVAYFFATDLVALAFADLGGLMPAEVWYRTAFLVLPMVIGIWLGSRRFETSDPASFRKLVLWLLMGISLLGLARTAF